MSEESFTSCNIASRLRSAAERLPQKTAVIEQKTGASLSFRDLDRKSDGYARGLTRIGIARGVTTLLMVKPGIDFFALTFGLFKAGAVPVLIDPGMGRTRLLHCIARAQPQALVGIPLAHLARLLWPTAFASVQQYVTVGRRWCWGGHAAATLCEMQNDPLPLADTRPDELAAVLFTTGSTGPAKGVEYEHGMFDRQCDLIAETYGIGEEDIDLPTFPLFGLFSVGLGMTAVIPDMDPTRPAQVDPAKIVAAVRDNGCTFSFGSPALWGRVSSYAVEQGITLPTLRTVLLAGAPVPPEVHERLLQSILPTGAQTHTPYGATESLPATNMTGREVLDETAERTRAGKGTCVGRPVPGNTVEIIRLIDEPIAQWSDDLVLPDGEIGEITVKGPTITKRYYKNEDATANAKIRDGETVRHRIGDLGYRDEKGRIWFCGRKSHRVETNGRILYTVCCEAVPNRLDVVRRSALVGVGSRPEQRPVLLVEPHRFPASDAEAAALRDTVRQALQADDLTRGIDDVLLHPSFPVDIRHNAKIFREQLAVWAEEQVR